MVFVYLATLEGFDEKPCYYVGTWAGQKVETRWHMHRSGVGGARFTQKYKPVSFKVLEICDTIPEAQRVENRYTELFIRFHGFRRVRGGDMVNCRPDCHTLESLKWWLSPRLQDPLLRGILGTPDPPILVESD